MKDIITLIDAICEARENRDFLPKNGETFCNYAVNYVASKMGYTKFKGMLANKICEAMRGNGDWLQIEPKAAQYHANQGELVIAGQIHPNGHGHVCIVRPGNLTSSGRWNSNEVPKIFNVGQDIFLDKGSNWAFTEKPNYFVLKNGE